MIQAILTAIISAHRYLSHLAARSYFPWPISLLAHSLCLTSRSLDLILGALVDNCVPFVGVLLEEGAGGEGVGRFYQSLYTLSLVFIDGLHHLTFRFRAGDFVAVRSVLLLYAAAIFGHVFFFDDAEFLSHQDILVLAIRIIKVFEFELEGVAGVGIC